MPWVNSFTSSFPISMASISFSCQSRFYTLLRLSWPPQGARGGAWRRRQRAARYPTEGPGVAQAGSYRGSLRQRLFPGLCVHGRLSAREDPRACSSSLAAYQRAAEGVMLWESSLSPGGLLSWTLLIPGLGSRARSAMSAQSIALPAVAGRAHSPLILQDRRHF